MHVADDGQHPVHRLGGGLDHEIHPLIEHGKVTVRNQAGDLDKGVAGEVKPGHLAVDPDEPVSHPPRLEPRRSSLAQVPHQVSAMRPPGQRLDVLGDADARGQRGVGLLLTEREDRRQDPCPDV